MKYLDEYRSEKYVKILLEQIHHICRNKWRIMEVCGGQTHNIVKYGLQDLLPSNIELIHGPGCPVCVTPIPVIDRAISLASRKEIILCTFGDMIRVPGTNQSLLDIKAEGGDVRIVYSPLDALKLAQSNLNKQVVFFGVGFETTAPAIAMVINLACRNNIDNFSVLVSNVRVPPVLDVLLSDPDCQVDGFLAAGNVCTVMGETEYYSIVDKYQVPIVITGFEPVDILQGIKSCVSQLESGIQSLENQYKRSVQLEGNKQAQKMLTKIFKVYDSEWRGLGLIPAGGFKLNAEYNRFNAELKFLHGYNLESCNNNLCMAGEVLQGKIKPNKCPNFGKRCSPETPLGAPMVSMEGACNAYYQYI